MKNIQIIPTIVPASFADIETVSSKFGDFTNFFQIDVADGKFAPNTTWMPDGTEKLPKEYSYEVHMMVSDPEVLGVTFANMGADTIIGHLEAFKNPGDVKKALDAWKEGGAHSTALAVLLQTPLKNIEPYLPIVDFVLFMTIGRIGVMGIPFEESSIDRIAAFHAAHPDVTIAVDGGVSEKNIERLTRAGATRFGVGSAISKSPDPKASYDTLKSLAENALQ